MLFRSLLAIGLVGAAGTIGSLINGRVQLARQYAKMWQDFARELDGRARIIDPSAAIRLTAG